MYLLDTTALSEPIRRRPHPGFLERLREVPSTVLYTFNVSVMELRYGCARRGDLSLWTRIRREILAHIQVLAFGPEEAVRCGKLLAELSRKGTPIGIEDAQIGATALVHQLTVVTSNMEHFQRIPGLRVVDWME